jgi:hypothetical protein
MQRILSTLILILIGFSITFSQTNKEIRLQKKATKRLKEWQLPLAKWRQLQKISIDTIEVNEKQEVLLLHFSGNMTYIPWREDNLKQTEYSIKEKLGRRFRNFDLQLVADGKQLHSLIPNYYRKKVELDKSRFSTFESARMPVVRRLDKPIPKQGFYNKNIALWNSHGWYYEAKLDRWEWQRARLFSTVEDLFPTGFVLPYLIPMLENAGANVFIPRERDTQTEEVIVDNDFSSDGSELITSGIATDTITNKGFLKKDTLFNIENPFLSGSYLRFKAGRNVDQFIDYIPNINSDGHYAVYISYQQGIQNISNVKYTVSHTGGKTDFLVNQKMGGGTWIYLGTFHFNKGKHPEQGSVRISSQSNEEGWITTDAIRFGGGMGNIARKPLNADPNEISWKTSGRPRYQEAARYYLQYAGAPDTLVYYLNKGLNDYNDDYQSRGEWVNYLMGSPRGPNKNREAPGLNIPVDLSLAFHTDAGITKNDSTIGTLAIYSAVRDEGRFPDGQSKMVNRDLADIIQTQIVNDIRIQFDADWSRRAMWDREYSEAWRPNVPALLLELLSHQNLADMKLGHDPRFKYAVSRAIYKGILKFLAFQHNSDYTVQPLPVDHFAIQHLGGTKIRLSWQAVADSLEPSAAPVKYKVYQREGNDGFDNGIIVLDNFLELEVPKREQIFSFKVTAVNDGGESFPSEILAIGLKDNDQAPVLVVNAFDRVSAPTVIDNGNFAGLAFWEDEGVADHYNIGYTGKQYDFDRNSPWLDDDSPGWGASYGNMEGKLIPGNNFDNTIVHGEAIMNAERSFVSVSDEAFSDPEFDLAPYQVIDLIFGEEKTTDSFGGKLFRVLDSELQSKVREFTSRGGNVLASGAYLGSDHVLTGDTLARNFANEVLHFKWRTNHAVTTGGVYATDYAKGMLEGDWKFNTYYHSEIYKVEAPDALEPFGEGAISALRYSENNTSAGVLFEGAYKTAVLGFPFETIIDSKERFRLMNQILEYFDK